MFNTVGFRIAQCSGVFQSQILVTLRDVSAQLALLNTIEYTSLLGDLIQRKISKVHTNVDVYFKNKQVQLSERNDSPYTSYTNESLYRKCRHPEIVAAHSGVK